MSKVLTIVTSNKKKIQEITAMLGNNFPIKIEWQGIDLPEYQGEVDDVSRAKCKTAANIVNGAVVVEDTCLW